MLRSDEAVARKVKEILKNTFDLKWKHWLTLYHNTIVNDLIEANLFTTPRVSNQLQMLPRARCQYLSIEE